MKDVAVERSDTPPSKRTRREKSTEPLVDKKGNDSSSVKRKTAKTPSKTCLGKSTRLGKVTTISCDGKGNLSKEKGGKPERGSKREGKITDSVSKGESRKTSTLASIKTAEIGDKHKTTKRSAHGKGNKKTGKSFIKTRC